MEKEKIRQKLFEKIGEALEAWEVTPRDIKNLTEAYNILYHIDIMSKAIENELALEEECNEKCKIVPLPFKK